ncbi:hydantoinase/oxoprolinase N-terminal domain-containing protein [Nonomuraea ferruginea]
MAEPDLRIGIDVGGTNTDAVVLDSGDRVIAKAKRPTSRDVTEGLRAALDAVLDELGPHAHGRIGRVMLGTTHATNAILERRNLGRVAVLRLGAPRYHGRAAALRLARRPARGRLGRARPWCPAVTTWTGARSA